MISRLTCFSYMSHSFWSVQNIVLLANTIVLKSSPLLSISKYLSGVCFVGVKVWLDLKEHLALQPLIVPFRIVGVILPGLSVFQK